MSATAAAPPSTAERNGARAVPHPSAAERAARGKAARRQVPRAAHAVWEAPPERRTPVDVLLAQEASRVPELLPIRHGRMLASPFAFFRGAAAVMAADLHATPQSGIRAQLCGDAHLSNFGGFASPERDLVFDINDFDETCPGPWEWDVKRLAASMAIAGRDLGFAEATRRPAVAATVRSYRETMRRFASMGNLAVFYARLDVPTLVAAVGDRASAQDRKAFKHRVAAARTKDNMRALAKLTGEVDGDPHFVSRPPLIVPIEDLPGGAAVEAEMRDLLRAYRRTLKSDRRRLLETYRYVHLARKVVGVGSVGTRAWVVLMMGRDAADPLFLQVKEATASVLEPFAGRDAARNHGQRVVQGQWLMQAASDIFLGWLRVDGIDGRRRDFYVRQMWDWKASADIGRMTPSRLETYGWMCGWTLARAHARSGDRIAIAAYLGSGDAFDRAVGAFAEAYADQNARDHAAFAAAANSGSIAVETGV
jgi:uncharacterized protein (DUF2252 family)